MSEHLSPLELDEAAAGLAPPPAHLSACADCATRLEELKAERASLLASPDAARRLDAVLAKQPELSARPKLKLLHVAAIALPLAAGIALLVFAPVWNAHDDRLKGAVTVELVDASGTAVTSAPAGQSVSLAVGGAGLPYVAVFAVDAQGEVAPLWPAKGEMMAALAPGARVTLSSFEVTPGDVTVHALFAKEARSMNELELMLEALVAQDKADHVPPLEMVVPPGVVDAEAHVRLVVK